MYGYFFLHVCLWTTCIPGVHRGHKISDSLRAAHVGAWMESESSGRTTSALNWWAIFPTQNLELLAFRTIVSETGRLGCHKVDAGLLGGHYCRWAAHIALHLKCFNDGSFQPHVLQACSCTCPSQGQSMLEDKNTSTWKHRECLLFRRQKTKS